MFRIPFIVVSVLLTICTAVSHGALAGSDFDNIYRMYRDTDSKVLSELGRGCIDRQSTDSAMAVFTILANRYDGNRVSQLDRKYAIEAQLSLGVLNFLNANYASAYSNFLAATELEGRDDSRGNLNLASIYLYYGDKTRAYRCLRHVFDAAVDTGNHYMASVSLINILTSNFDSSIIPDDTVRSIIDRFRTRVTRTSDNTAWPLAHCYAEAKRYSLDGHDGKAISMLKASLDSVKYMLMPNREIFASYTALGRKYLDMGVPDSAEYYLKKAENIAKDHLYPELLTNAYSDLSRMYSILGRKDLSDKYRFMHLELHDSMFNAREFGNIHDLELFHETDKFEKKLNRMRVEEKMRTRIIAITVTSIFVLGLMLVILYMQYRALRIKNRSLFERNLEIMSTLSPDCNVQEGTVKKPAGQGPNDETRSQISEGIRKAMSDESVFCMEGFTMRELSDMCGSNQKYVSQVLNDDYGKTFTQLLNECRINVARRRLIDFENYGNLTIEAIVSDLGFKSRSTFSKTFKRITGLTPSEFQRIAAEEKENQEESLT